MMKPWQPVIEFWFERCTPKQWFQKDPQFDKDLAKEFSSLHRSACLAELSHWRSEPLGRLAEIIVLDQFSRNLFRDQPQSFAYDGMALALAQEAVGCGADQSLSALQRSFLYMPYMHSESAKVHIEAEKLYRANGLADNLRFELHHKAIVDRFGRYPHRNAILGRESTQEEIEFLNQPGSSF